MLPLLRFAGEKKGEISTGEAVEVLAKRWDNNPVGRPEVTQFAGALHAQKANKGIFMATSRFTDDTCSDVSQIGNKIALIDGEQLRDLMMENDVGVSTVSLYPLKQIETDYLMGAFDHTCM